MKSVDKALSEYVDSLNNNLLCSVDSYKEQMTPEDYTEFNDLAKFIALVVVNEDQKSNLALFNKLNAYREELYNQKSASNFRTRNASKESMDILEKIFTDEFENND